MTEHELPASKSVLGTQQHNQDFSRDFSRSVTVKAHQQPICYVPVSMFGWAKAGTNEHPGNGDGWI
jgi:hypothetical protein